MRFSARWSGDVSVTARDDGEFLIRPDRPVLYPGAHVSFGCDDVSSPKIFMSVSGYLLVGLLERALSVVILPITTRLFSTTDFAALVAINNVTALINLGAVFFFIRSLTPTVASLHDEDERRNMATTIFWTTAAIGALSFSAVWAMAPKIGELLKQPEGFAALLRIAVAAAFAASLAQAVLALTRALERHHASLVVQIVAIAIQAAVMLYLLLILRLGVESLFWAGLAWGIINLVGHLPWLGHYLLGRPTARHLRQAAVMGAHLLALQIGTLLVLNCSGLILNYVGLPGDAALFGIASGAASLGLIAALAFDSVWTAHFLRRRNDPGIHQVARRMFEVHSAVLLVGSAAGCLFAREVFTILVGPRFVEAYVLLPPLIGCIVLFSFIRNFGQGLLLQARPHRSAWMGCASAAVYLAIGMPAAGHFGALGLIGAMAAALFILLVCSQRESFRMIPIRYPWGSHAALWIGSGILPAMLAFSEPSWSNFALKVAVLVTVSTVAATRVWLASPKPIRHQRQ